MILMTFQGFAQEDQQQKLEQRKAQIQEEIRENERLLQATKKKEKSVKSLIEIQKTKINLKERLINTTEKQTKLLSNDMYVNQIQINHLKKELELLKEDYAEMIVKSYKSRSEQSRAMFLLSSENFLQAYKRAQYMKQYTSYRKMQGEEIKDKSAQLALFNDKLGVQKTAKQKLIEENEKERIALQIEKQEQEKLINSLKKDKKKIISEINKKQKESRSIERQIDKLIREAIAEANRKAREAEIARNKAEIARKTAEAKAAGKKYEAPVVKIPVVVASPTKFVLSTEGQALSNNFKANRGRLPWPVDKGIVYSAYGQHAHPVIKTLVVHNSGVEIETESGSSARAVFSGEVMKVQLMSNVKVVYIKHGDFITVYQNLSKVYVALGDKVAAKQSIGQIHKNASEKTILKFLIYQNATILNPQVWINNM